MSKLKHDGILAGMGMITIALFIFLTNPRSLSVALLLFLPVMIAVTVFALSRLLLRLMSSMTERLLNLISGIVSAGSLLVVLLSSLKQFGLQDGLLALLLVAGLVFYFRRTGAGQAQPPQA